MSSFPIVFLKRVDLTSGHCRAAFSLASASLPHAASALPASTVVSSPPFVYENHVCVKTDYYIAHAGVHYRHPDDARHGVSRPQIKKFVEEKYKLEIGNAQITQLSRAIAVGAEKNVFSLPKGPSGRVKLAPKAPKVADDAKENKPALKTKTATTKAAPKLATKPGSKTKAVTSKSTTTKSSSGRKVPSSKTSPPKAASSAKTVKKHVPTAKPPKTSGRTSTTRADSALKKTYAGKKLPSGGKVKSSTSKGTAKKAATGSGSASKASKSKAASTKKATSKAGSTSRTTKSTRRT